jgi:uncharacterized protein (TIGR02466 family)
MKRHEIFPVPIWEFTYSEAEAFREKIVPMFKDIENKNPNKEMTYTKEGYTSYGPITNILDYDECKEMKNFIMGNVVEAVKDLGLEGYCNMTGSWFNNNRKYSSHGPHNHVPDTISGIYYVQAEENDARISFHDQNKISNWPWKAPSVINDMTRRVHSFKPKTGRLLLFPSYIEHSVEQQLTDNERISISFNAFVG